MNRKDYEYDLSLFIKNKSLFQKKSRTYCNFDKFKNKTTKLAKRQ